MGVICGIKIPKSVFINFVIGTLRLVAPFSFLYVAWALFGSAPERLNSERAPLYSYIFIYASLEAAFFTCVYLPRRYHLQKAANHPKLSRMERRRLFQRCCQHVGSPHDFASGWFPQSMDFKKENFFEWILWGFLSIPLDASHDCGEDEMAEYLETAEQMYGRKIPDGYNKNARCIRPTLDPVCMLHRPLLWYTIIGVVDFTTGLGLYSRGFRHYTDKRLFQSFPPRLFTLFSRSSNVQGLSYWYRPHRSVKESPMLFLHGIGIGLSPYTGFLADFAMRYPDSGIIVPEFLSISSRITAPPLSRSDTITAIRNILDTLNLGNVVVVAHSYGTVVTSQLLRSSLASRITASLLVDPIPFLLHHPDLAYNFMYRQPTTAYERLLWYFASRDPDISRTLSRHFFWAENILWKEDLVDKVVAVALSGRDRIVNAEAVRKYLTGEDEGRMYWQGGDARGRLEVLCYPELGHAMIFNLRKRWKRLMPVLDRFVREAH